MPETVFHEAPYVVFYFLETRSRSVGIAIGRHAGLPAQELIDRHVGALGLDVPQSLVHAAHGVVKHRPVAPVGTHIHRLPNVFDMVGVFADQERLEKLVDGGDDGFRALIERRTAEAIEAGLAGLDLDDRQAYARRSRQDCFYVGDFQRRQSPPGLSLLGVGLGPQRVLA